MRRLKDQPQVKVVASAYDAKNLDNIRFMLLAAVFAGFFYFFGENLWLALSGG